MKILEGSQTNHSPRLELLSCFNSVTIDLKFEGLSQIQRLLTVAELTQKSGPWITKKDPI